MHQAWSFASGLKKQFADSPQVKRIVDYVVKRQNYDGGYSFVQGLDSNAQDTYYALSILDLLKVPFPNIKETIKWLRDFSPDGHYSHYYVAKALKLCGKNPHRSLKHFLLSHPVSRGGLGTGDFYGYASKFQQIFMITDLAKMVGIEIDRKKTTSWLLSHKNGDGGFGAHGHSDLNSTFHAVTSLFNLGHPVKSLKETLEYVRSCENQSGGFTFVPSSSSSFMENIYYGVSTLELLGEHARYPEKTAELIWGRQNSNGGFARSEVGISTLEDTFYAVIIRQMICR